MSTIVDKLPPHVMLSEHLQDKVSKRFMGKKKFKYIQITHFGFSYYIPITKAVWKAFHLDEHIRNPEGDVRNGGVRVDDMVEDALRDIVGAIYDQAKKEILGEVEQAVLQSVHNRIDEVLHQPLRAEIKRRADEAEQKALVPENLSNKVSGVVFWSKDCGKSGL